MLNSQLFKSTAQLKKNVINSIKAVDLQIKKASFSTFKQSIDDASKINNDCSKTKVFPIGQVIISIYLLFTV